MTCELCGALKVATRLMVVERANLRACRQCIERTGRTWEAPRPDSSPPAIAVNPKKSEFSGGYRSASKSKRDIMTKDVEELVDDFHRPVSAVHEVFGRV